MGEAEQLCTLSLSKAQPLDNVLRVGTFHMYKHLVVFAVSVREWRAKYRQDACRQPRIRNVTSRAHSLILNSHCQTDEDAFEWALLFETVVPSDSSVCKHHDT